MLVRLKRDVRAIGRPRRPGPLCDDLLRRTAARRHNPDAAAALRVIRDEPAVRRPRWLHVLPAIAGQRCFRRRSIERPHHDLERSAPIGDVRDRIVVRRERWMQIEACMRRQLHRPLSDVRTRRRQRFSTEHFVSANPDERHRDCDGQRDDGNQRDARARWCSCKGRRRDARRDRSRRSRPIDTRAWALFRETVPHAPHRRVPAESARRCG